MDERTTGTDVLPVTFGSASLLDRGDDVAAARSVLEAAIDAGATRLDVAPMYGHGLLEPMVLAVGAERDVPVTTKVGIEPRPRSPLWRRAAARTVRAMPTRARGMVRRAAGAPEEDTSLASGRFAIAVVQASIERSLRRSRGRLDRLLLHEVHPADVTDELLALLTARREAGDVGELGCATRNPLTGPVLERGAGVLTVAHVSTAPFGDPTPVVPPTVRLVGHGALGAGGSDLHRIQELLRRGEIQGSLEAGARTGEADVLLRCLFARARRQGVAELLVATTRRERVRGLVAAAGSAEPTDDSVTAVLDRAVRHARGDHRGGGDGVHRPADQR